MELNYSGHLDCVHWDFVSSSFEVLFFWLSQDASGEAVQDHVGEDQGSCTSKVMCRMCFSGENEGSKRAMRMLSCRLCNKKYHRKCLKSWSAFRGSCDSP